MVTDPKMIKAVLLDIDNTLLDFDQCTRDAMKEGFRKFELPPYKDYMFDAFLLVNNEIWRDFEQGRIDFEGILNTRWQRVFELLNIAFDGYTFEKYFVEYIFNSHILIDGAQELLKYLNEKYLVCAATNGPEEQQINRLKQAGILGYFQLLFISEKMGVVKPEKEFYAQVMAQLQEKLDGNIRSEEIMAIGDSLTSDIAGGQESGMQTCYFNPENKPLEGKVIPDYSVAALAEIKNIL